jgi:hypothetical protein
VATGEADVLGFCKYVREQEPQLVPNEELYAFVYYALFMALPLIPRDLHPPAGGRIGAGCPSSGPSSMDMNHDRQQSLGVVVEETGSGGLLGINPPLRQLQVRNQPIFVGISFTIIIE